jgi:hypothetical protein
LSNPETRAGAWAWMKQNIDKLVAAGAVHFGRERFISMGTEFCDEAHIQEMKDLWTPARVAQIEGGPRVLDQALDDMHRCVAVRQAQEASAAAFFEGGPR